MIIDQQTQQLAQRLAPVLWPLLARYLYAQGSYTPTMIGGTTAGVTTYARQLGYYVRIGRQITVWIDLSWTAATGTGDAHFSLPFPTSSDIVVYPGALRLTGTTWTGTDPEVVINAATSYFRLQGVSSNAGPTISAVEGAGAITAVAIYLVD